MNVPWFHIWYRMDMVEAYLQIEDTMEYYKCGDFPFNFFFITELPRSYDRDVTAGDVWNVITLWMSNMDTSHTANWVVSDVKFTNNISDCCRHCKHDSWEIMTNGESGAGTARTSLTRGM